MRMPKRLLAFTLDVLLVLSVFSLVALSVWQIKPAYATSSFGYTTVAANPHNNPDCIWTCLFTCPSIGLGISMSVYVVGGSHVMGALYDVNTTLIANTTEITVSGDGWQTMNFNGSAPLKAQDYIFAVDVDAGSFYTDAGAANQIGINGLSYGSSWPANCAAGDTAWVMSVFVNYTATTIASVYGATSNYAGLSSDFYSYWLAVGSLNYSIFSCNNTGPVLNETAVPFSGSGSQWANTTKTLNATVHVIQWQIIVNDSTGAEFTTGLQNLGITVPSPTYSNIYLIGQKAGQASHLNIFWTAVSPSTLSFSVLCWNSTGPFVNQTAFALSGTTAWHNFTGTANSTVGNVIIAWFYANNSVNQWTQTSNVTFVTYADTMALHAVGTELQDDTNMTVILRGVDYTYFIDGPLGSWQKIGGGVDWNTWNPTALNDTLDAMATWGSNCIRVLATTEWWTENTSGFISNLETFITCARDRGLYVDFTFWRNNATGIAPSSGISDPGNNIINSTADFVNLWWNISATLRVYSNVLFELWNEPSSTKATWFAATQECFDAMRNVSSNIVVAQWGSTLGVDFSGYSGYEGGSRTGSIWTLDWIADYPLTDLENNILYSAHLYRDGFYDSSQGYIQINSPTWVNYTSNDLWWALNITGLLYVQKPLWVGEIGCSSWASDQTQEQGWFSASLILCNQYSVGYCAWAGPPYPTQWNLCTGAANYAPTTSGTLLIAAIGIFPPYITINSPSNTTYTSSIISVSFTSSGGSIDEQWFNIKNGSAWVYGSNQTYTSPTYVTGFVNGSSYTLYAWVNNTLGTQGSATVMFSVAIYGVDITIASPTNATYSSSNIIVSFSASGGTIHQKWFNCKNGTNWIYISNQTYTVTMNMTGFVNGTSYTFYAWANNTLGDQDEATIMFSVGIYVVPPTDLSYVAVSLNSPINGYSTTSTVITFTYTPYTTSTFENASLYLNVSGTWQSAGLNTTAILNNTVNSWTYMFLTYGTFSWNIQVYNTTASAFANTNFTITLTVPTLPPSTGNVFYFCPDTQTINTVTGYKLSETQPNSNASASISASGNLTGYVAYRVFIVYDDGTMFEISSGYIAITGRTNDTEGLINATWTCPKTSLNVGFQALRVEMYMQIGSGGWIDKATFISGFLNETEITASTWIFQTYTKHAYTGGSTIMTATWGTSIANSLIDNVGVTDPGIYDLLIYQLNMGNFVGFIFMPYTNLVGNLFYGLLLLVFFVPLYNRYKSFSPIIILLILFGGAGGILSLMVPEAGLGISWIFLVVGIGGLIYKVFR